MPKPDRSHLTPVRDPGRNGPPAPVGAEEAVLGAILTAGRLLPEAADQLTQDDFYRPAHRTLWQSMAALDRQGQPVDPVTVAAELTRQGVLDDLGGVLFLHHLTEVCPTVAHATVYARQVAAAARRRQVMDLGTRITAGAGDPARDLAELAQGWRGELEATLTPAGDPIAGRAQVQRVAEVARQPLRWLWEGRLPAGKLVVLDGDPGNGKSTLTCDLAARVSTGSPMPYATPRPDGPAGVVLLTAEDDIADTVRPRLEAAGADLGRVVVLRQVTSPDGPRLPSLPGDLEIIGRLIQREHAALVVIDPLMAFLGAEVKTNADQDVRRALHPMTELAAATGAAMVIIRHLNKTGGGSPLYRGGGSIGIVGAVRLGLLVARDPEDDHRRILAVQKTNLAATAPALAYRLAPDERLGCARVVWDGPTDYTAAQLLSAGTEDAEEGYARREAEDFLRELLTPGPIRAKQAITEARDAGLSERTLARARKTLGIKPIRLSQAGADRGRGEWWWELPTTPPDTDGSPLDVGVSDRSVTRGSLERPTGGWQP